MSAFHPFLTLAGQQLSTQSRHLRPGFTTRAALRRTRTKRAEEEWPKGGYAEIGRSAEALIFQRPDQALALPDLALSRVHFQLLCLAQRVGVVSRVNQIRQLDATRAV